MRQLDTAQFAVGIHPKSRQHLDCPGEAGSISAAIAALERRFPQNTRHHAHVRCATVGAGWLCFRGYAATGTWCHPDRTER